ncbi:MAG TPA: Gfo/Idh/MocA family oxidoreductase [Capsulimonadaceae bacterium]|jgi:predicted dehydrogenase
MDRIRIGVVGVGQIGKQHLENYSKIPGAELAAFCDIDEAELARVASLYGVTSTTTNFRELIMRDDIDAVDVCLHNNLHAPVAIAALQAGKHVYCEKPMAGSYRDAAAMLEAAKSCDRKLHIQLAFLYSRETRAAKLLIENGRLGKLYHARSTGYRRRGRPYVDGYGTLNFVRKDIAAGGALYDMGVYHISQLLYLMGMPKPLRISGKTYQETDMDANRRESGRYDVEELGLGLVRFEGGLTLDIIEAWAIHLNAFEGSCVVGSKGGIRLEPFSFHTTQDEILVDSTYNLGNAYTRWHDVHGSGDVYDSSQQHWIAVLQGRAPLLPTAEIALQTLLISEGIYLSDSLAREVSVDEVIKSSVSTAVNL